MQDIDNGLCALKFGATWCGPCKIVNNQIEKMQQEFNSVNFFNIDVDDSPALAKKYGIKNLPTVILLKDGKEIERLVGSVKIESMRRAFREFVEPTAA